MERIDRRTLIKSCLENPIPTGQENIALRYQKDSFTVNGIEIQFHGVTHVPQMAQLYDEVRQSSII